MKRIFLCFGILFYCHSVFAETLVLKKTFFQANTQNALEKLEDSLKYPEELLKRFEPTGARISKKYASENVVSFVGTKSWLGLSKSILVRGVLESERIEIGCSKTEKRFDVTFKFEGSDSLVADNFEMIKIKLCVTESSNQSSIDVQIYPSLVQGKKYSTYTGPYVQTIIEAQVTPIIKALNTVIMSK